VSAWTNEAAIRRWAQTPPEALAATAVDGDFAKRHLVNPDVLRLLGDVAGRRVLDAGCGNGYLSRMLAARGAYVVGVEPAQSLYEFAVAAESTEPRGIRYVQADVCAMPDLGAPFDAVVASMVLQAVPDWRDAMRACVAALTPGGRFVFTCNHPCFEQLWSTWQRHGDYRTRRYLAEYEIDGPHGMDFHRPLSAYLNALVTSGCTLTEVVEPALDPSLAAGGPDGVEAYADLPNFLIVAATRT